ncbi:hypothetical protein [Streptomyces lasiicapitis]
MIVPGPGLPPLWSSHDVITAAMITPAAPISAVATAPAATPRIAIAPP